MVAKGEGGWGNAWKNKSDMIHFIKFLDEVTQTQSALLIGGWTCAHLHRVTERRPCPWAFFCGLCKESVSSLEPAWSCFLVEGLHCTLIAKVSRKRNVEHALEISPNYFLLPLLSWFLKVKVIPLCCKTECPDLWGSRVEKTEQAAKLEAQMLFLKVPLSFSDRRLPKGEI